MSSAVQTSFFNLIESDSIKAPFVVQKIGENLWIAFINSGWWMTYGQTETEAIKHFAKRSENDEIY